MTTTRQAARVHAARVSKGAHKFALWLKRNFYNDPYDRGFDTLDLHREMQRDVRDLRRVAALLRDGKVLRALDRAERLDSIVREQIPVSAWRFMRRTEKAIKGY